MQYQTEIKITAIGMERTVPIVITYTVCDEDCIPYVFVQKTEQPCGRMNLSAGWFWDCLDLRQSQCLEKRMLAAWMAEREVA